MKKRPPRNVLEHCIANLGMLGGTRCASFIACWAIASADLDRPITVEEYAEWWRESERTAYRHLAEFRRAFPQFKDATPQVIADLAKRQRAAPATLGGLPLTALA